MLPRYRGVVLHSHVRDEAYAELELLALVHVSLSMIQSIIHEVWCCAADSKVSGGLHLTYAKSAANESVMYRIAEEARPRFITGYIIRYSTANTMKGRAHAEEYALPLRANSNFPTGDLKIKTATNGNYRWCKEHRAVLRRELTVEDI